MDRLGSHYINIEAISYVDLETEAGKLIPDGVKVYLNNGYWFTLSGTYVEEFLSLIRDRASVQFKKKLGEN